MSRSLRTKTRNLEILDCEDVDVLRRPASDEDEDDIDIKVNKNSYSVTSFGVSLVMLISGRAWKKYVMNYICFRKYAKLKNGHFVLLTGRIPIFNHII